MGEVTRRYNASALILISMISGVVTLLTTRAWQKLYDYPQIVFGDWHIAHVLFGGMFLMAAILVLLVFNGEKVRKVGAVLGGIGWGLFIDEVGKYLTKDNDYWFRPAIIFIYISFIGLFLVYQYLERHKKDDNTTLLFQQISWLEQIIENDFDPQEKEDALRKIRLLLHRHHQNDNLRIMALGLKRTILEIKPNGSANKLAEWITEWFKKSYDYLFKRKFVLVILWCYSIFYAGSKIWETLTVSLSKEKMMMIEKFYEDYDFFGKSDVYMVALKMICDVLAAGLFLMGARYFWGKKRVVGLRYFQYGLYANIFLASIFKFYFEQFGAVVELFLAIALLFYLKQYRREMRLKRENVV